MVQCFVKVTIGLSDVDNKIDNSQRVTLYNHVDSILPSLFQNVIILTWTVLIFVYSKNKH